MTLELLPPLTRITVLPSSQDNTLGKCDLKAYRAVHYAHCSFIVHTWEWTRIRATAELLNSDKTRRVWKYGILVRLRHDKNWTSTANVVNLPYFALPPGTRWSHAGRTSSHIFALMRDKTERDVLAAEECWLMLVCAQDSRLYTPASHRPQVMTRKCSVLVWAMWQTWHTADWGWGYLGTSSAKLRTHE